MTILITFNPKVAPGVNNPFHTSQTDPPLSLSIL